MQTLSELSGVLFRPFQFDTDIEVLCQIVHGCREVDQIDPYSTLEGLPSPADLRRDLGDVDPQTMLLAEADGRPIGFNRLLWWTESDGLTLYLHLGKVLPNFRGRGIGSALLGWSEARIRQLALEHQSRAMYGANASSTETDATRLLLNNDYKVVFTMAQMEFTQMDDLRPPTLADGITIRAPEPDDAPKLWAAMQSAYAAIPVFGMPASDPQEIEELESQIEQDGRLWRVAWAGEEVAAQIWCSIAEFEGSRTGVMDEVNTSHAFQRKGIRQALMIQTLLMFKEMGIGRVRLHTDAGNRRGALTFYEKIGFTCVKTFPRYRKAF